ncbi:EAL and HDOD domain-containing protein [Oleidesulfovibrio sp.]|uniref:EAL and HDOD domain-containing protein n=1 Tax=Oleidesulfovibrio sp. TaxID=2909707 RepID=UPI003A8A078F
MDTEKRIWGYELLGGEIQQGIFTVFPEQTGAAASLGSSAYFRLQEDMERGKRVMIAFDAESILMGVPKALPPQSGAIRVSQEATKTENVTQALKELKSEGYTIAIDCSHASKPEKNCMLLADVVCVDFSVKAAAIACSRGDTSSVMLARNIKDNEQFEAARRMGIALFEGPFFKAPEVTSGRSLSSHEVARIELMSILESPSPDPKAIAEAVKADVSLTFRLLSLLNSSAFGLRQKVTSVDHAVTLLGWEQTRSWLRAVLVADMASRSDGSQELAFISMQRAHFLQQLTTHYDYWGFNPETLFLLGMFSLLDAILGIPMEEVTDMLPLSSKLKESLLGDPNNEHKPLFDLLTSLEDGDLEVLSKLVPRLGFEPELVRKLYSESMDWAASFFATQKSKD